MSNLKYFLKSNKKVRENVKFKATESLVNENGEVLEWEIRPISTEENDKLKDDNMTEVPVPGKVGMYRPKLNVNDYTNQLIASSIVVPNLFDAELQDSYGVKTPEELIVKMIDNPGEFNALSQFIQNLNGFTKTLDEKVDEAKN